MEMVKIDAQKLQLLNDRINQTIDALNQVRLSTHGLQHSTGQVGVPQWGQGQIGLQGQQVAPAAFYGQGIPTQGIPMQVMPQAGLEHSSPRFDPSRGQFAFNSAGAPIGFGPTLAPGAFTPSLGQGAQAFGVPSMGISHTAPTIDPYWQLRAQAQVPVAYPQQYLTPQVIPY